MNLENRIKNFTAARELMKAGYYPYFKPIESAQDTEVYIDGKKMLMLGSNAYLGYTNDERVKQAAIEAIKKYGTGNAGSRFLNGTLDIHEKLEKRLAKFVNKEAALLFGTGYMANLGTISGLLNQGDAVITDKLDHASIIDGCRLSGAKMYRFKHNDIADLERILKKATDELGEKAAKLIVVDGVFSMEGDLADVPRIVEVAKKYDAWVMVDDAHGLGVMGEYGRGTVHYYGMDDEVDIIMGTFSKSFATLGGFIASSEDVVHYLRHHSRALIFSASPPPAVVATVDKVLDLIYEEPERIDKLWHNTKKMMEGFKKMGYDIGNTVTPIIPLKIGDFNLTLELWKRLWEAGIFTNPVVPPAVPPKETIIRTSYMATHTDEQLDWALSVFEKIGKELGIIPS